MCWIIPILVGLAGFVFGYLYSKFALADDATALAQANSDNAVLKSQLQDLRAQLQACQNQKAKFISDSEQLIQQHKDSDSKNSDSSTDDTEKTDTQQ